MQWLCYYALRRKRHDFGSQLLFRQICYGKIEKRNHTPDSTRLDREGITHFLVCTHFLLLGVPPEWELSPPLFLVFVHEVRSQNLLDICFSWLGQQRNWFQCVRSGFGFWVGKVPAEGHGNPLQYFCLEDATGGGAWWATSLGLQRWTWLSSSEGTTFYEEGLSWDKGWSWGQLISSTKFIYTSQLCTFYFHPLHSLLQILIPQFFFFFLRKGVH